MSSWYFIFYLFCGFSLLQQWVEGIPYLDRRVYPQPETGQWTLDDVTVDKLRQAMCRKPVGNDVCLFYTTGQGLFAKELVQGPNVLGATVTIWDCWPKEYLPETAEEIASSQLRDLYAGYVRGISAAEYNKLPIYKYFTAMSDALALECGGERAYVMTPDVENIPTDGIWALVEYPTLTRPDAAPPQKVEKIIAVEASDPNTQKQLFPPVNSKRRDMEGSIEMVEVKVIGERDADCDCGYPGALPSDGLGISNF